MEEMDVFKIKYDDDNFQTSNNSEQYTVAITNSHGHDDIYFIWHNIHSIQTTDQVSLINKSNQRTPGFTLKWIRRLSYYKLSNKSCDFQNQT